MRTRLSRSVGLVEPAAKSAAKPGKTVAHFGPSRSTKTRHLNSRAPSGSSWSTSEQGFDRLQNGCSASFLVEGEFDSHAPPPAKFDLKTAHPFGFRRCPSSLSGHPNWAVFQDLLPNSR